MSNNDYKLKSECIEKVVAKQNHGNIKDNNKLCFTDVLEFVANASSIAEINEICDDLNMGNIQMGMDANTVDYIIRNAENENIKYLLSHTYKNMSIDVKDIKDLSSEKLKKIRSLGCQIDKVYVNSGWDKAAAQGYHVNVYNAIISQAEGMVSKALKNLPANASEEQRFMAIYNAVLENTVYDYDTIEAETANKGHDVNSSYTSRNLEGFFIDKTSVCAGTALVLEQLCKMNGIEAEYVQGMSKSPKENESHLHAWVKVKVDGKWFNADPTWDANKVGREYQYCLKSDKDFKGHQADESYCPSYNRDGSVSHERIRYHSSYDSKDSSYLESEYYTDSLREKAGGRALTNDEIRALNSRPDSSGVMPARVPFIFAIIDKILNFGRMTKSKFQSLFSSNKISKNELNALEGKSDDEIEEYAKSLHVDQSSHTENQKANNENQERQDKEADERADR